MYNISPIRAICKADFLSIIRNKSTIVFNLCFPLMFIVIFGFVSNKQSKTKVAFSDQARNSFVYDFFSKSANFEIVNLESKDIKTKLIEGQIVAYINIDSNANGLILKISNTQTNADAVLLGIKSIIYDIEKHINKTNNYKQVNIEQNITADRHLSKTDFLLPGMLGFSIMASGIFGVAFSFFSMRQNLVFKRILCTPISKMEIILGQLLSRIIFQLVNTVVLILIGYFVFHFTMFHGFMSLLNILIFCFIGMLCFMVMGFFISSIVKHDSAIPALTNIVSLPQMLLGGVFFSNQIFPSWLRVISEVLPLTHLNNAIRRIAFYGDSVFMLTYELSIIVIWFIVGLIACVRVFKWE